MHSLPSFFIGPKFTLFLKIGSKLILAFCSKIGPKFRTFCQLVDGLTIRLNKPIFQFSSRDFGLSIQNDIFIRDGLVSKLKRSLDVTIISNLPSIKRKVSTLKYEKNILP